MIIDFSQEIIDLDGKPFMNPKDGDAEPEAVTLRQLACTALGAAKEGETDGEAKAMRGSLSIRIYDNPEAAEVTTDEAAFIKKLIGEYQGSTVAVARAHALIEAAGEPDPKKNGTAKEGKKSPAKAG